MHEPQGEIKVFHRTCFSRERKIFVLGKLDLISTATASRTNQTEKFNWEYNERCTSGNDNAYFYVQVFCGRVGSSIQHVYI